MLLTFFQWYIPRFYFQKTVASFFLTPVYNFFKLNIGQKMLRLREVTSNQLKLEKLSIALGT